MGVNVLISAVILAKNSSQSIAEAVKSVNWCDEVLVIDDNSTDDTARIAKLNKAKVVQRSLADDFAAQRNWGLSKAKGEWVLFIDSDEVVSDALAAEIQSIIRNTDRVAGYRIRRVDFLFGQQIRHGETGNIWFVRLAKRTAGLWRRSVHEIWDISGPVGQLSEPLLHFPHRSISDFVTSVKHYSHLHAIELYREGVEFYIWQIVVYPVAKFIQNYVVRLGFLDGTPGFIQAMMMSLHSFMTRARMWEWKTGVRPKP